MNANVISGLDEMLSSTQEILSQDLGVQISFDSLFNERFYEEIFNSLIAVVDQISDSNELFLRSYQLSELVKKYQNSIEHQDTQVIQTAEIAPVNNDTDEIEKVHRKVPGWFKKPNQFNSRILIAYLRLKDRKQQVLIQDLDNCLNMRSFLSNFNQMKIASPKNHAKVFDVVGDEIHLWKPVQNFILEQYSMFTESER
ncbi:hypothetical protein THIOSC15_2890007 [uncultured Thiomicrorhabdus sp.]